MKKIARFSVAVGVFALASCANRGSVADSSTQEQMIQMKDYLNLPKLMAGRFGRSAA